MPMALAARVSDRGFGRGARLAGAKLATLRLGGNQYSEGLSIYL